MHEHEQDRQGRQICTTSGDAPSKVRAEQVEEVGQHKSYLVLCEEERQKGFVRPYRDAYKHVGRSICAKMISSVGYAGRLGGPRRICDLEHGHKGSCDGSFRDVDQPTHAHLTLTHRAGGCGKVTTMGRALSETYARDPQYYGATFCATCRSHFPVGEECEFVWLDGQKVGS